MSKAKQTFSPAELGGALGVSESSVKRWIDAGTLHATKTPGGHRRVALPEALRFVRETGRSLGRPAELGLQVAPAAEDAMHQAYRDALASGDDSVVRDLALLRFGGGASIGDLSDTLLLPEFQALRDACPHPSEHCVTLHRAVELTQATLRVLAEASPVPAADAPLALVADVGYEVDALPAACAEAVFRAAGWRCTNLGKAVPQVVLAGAIPRTGPRAVWLSASGPVDAAPLAALVEAARDAAHRVEASVIGFGPSLPAEGIDLRLESLRGLEHALRHAPLA